MLIKKRLHNVIFSILFENVSLLIFSKSLLKSLMKKTRFTR